MCPTGISDCYVSQSWGDFSIDNILHVCELFHREGLTGIVIKDQKITIDQESLTVIETKSKMIKFLKSSCETVECVETIVVPGCQYEIARRMK